MNFIQTLSELFPRGKAFRSVTETTQKKLLRVLSLLPENTREELEKVYGDLFPETTGEIEKWEKQFGIIFTANYPDAIRRSLLYSFWSINKGGQSAEYLQQILQQIDIRIKVIENVPVGNPRVSNVVFAAVNGNKKMINGGKFAVNGYRIGDGGFVPTVLRNDTEEAYSIPIDSKHWEACFYVCGGVVRNVYHNILYVNKIIVNPQWKKFIEYIVLKIKPVHSTAVLFIQYQEVTGD